MPTSSLPRELLDVLEQAPTVSLVGLDAQGRPHVRDARASLHRVDCLDVAADAPADPRVAVLLGHDHSSHCVLVQGTATGAEGGVHVRPARIYAWPAGDPDAEPRLWDAHLEEVRAAHNAEPELPHSGPEGGEDVWDGRLDGLGGLAALAFIGPDGFPFAVRLVVTPDAGAHVVRLDGDPVGAPIDAGPACLSAGGIEVYGDLVEEQGRWVLHPHAVG
jgi:hypothetical protein